MLFNNEYIGQPVYTYVFQTWLADNRHLEFSKNDYGIFPKLQE